MRSLFIDRSYQHYGLSLPYCIYFMLNLHLITVAGVLPKYFSSEWSFSQFRVPEETKAIVAFGSMKNTIVIVCANGRYVVHYAVL